MKTLMPLLVSLLMAGAALGHGSHGHPGQPVPMTASRTTERIVLPDIPEIIAPIVYALPIQMLAYYTAVFMGTDVDQPRNLAKSVTVE